MLNNIIWKPVKDFENHYHINNFGSVKRIFPSNGATVNKILKPCVNKYGYYILHLSKHGKQINRSVHRLVLESFIGLRPKDYECNHKDGNRLNNNLDNLEWVTQYDNLLHRNTAKGEDSPKSKLKKEDILKIRHLYKNGFSFGKISKFFNVHKTQISRICKRQSWSHV